jgi:hypothetical protein
VLRRGYTGVVEIPVPSGIKSEHLFVDVRRKSNFFKCSVSIFGDS